MKKTYLILPVMAGIILSISGCASNKSVPEPVEAPVEETAAETPAAPSRNDDEYARSKGELNISKDTFEEDKREILRIISELDSVMAEASYNNWVPYLDQESADYWSKKGNLQKASQRLPVKGLRLTTLNDYFKYVFIPSRKGRTVDEIRYETETSVKAVQVDGETDTVYYNFKKINGEWKVHLPELTD